MFGFYVFFFGQRGLLVQTDRPTDRRRLVALLKVERLIYEVALCECGRSSWTVPLKYRTQGGLSGIYWFNSTSGN